MPTFILRNLEPVFWSRVQAAAKVDGQPLRAFVLDAIAALVDTVETDAEERVKREQPSLGTIARRMLDR